MLDWLNFRFEEIIYLIYAVEKRYYQNKTQLRYNFGSVYFTSKRISNFAHRGSLYTKTKTKAYVYIAIN